MEEAGQKISHYLLAQLLINSGFGLAIGVILFFLDVPYALLWGFLATMLRFIPMSGHGSPPCCRQL
jgi:Predicted permease